MTRSRDARRSTPWRHRPPTVVTRERTAGRGPRKATPGAGSTWTDRGSTLPRWPERPARDGETRTGRTDRRDGQTDTRATGWAIDAHRDERRGKPGAGAAARAAEAAVPSRPVWASCPATGRSEQTGRSSDRSAAPRTRSAKPSGSARREIRRGTGSREPHGCVWLKYTTGSREEEAARVVRNGAGGTERVWKPATRHGGTGSARAGTGRPGSTAARVVGGTGGTRRAGKWTPRTGSAEGERSPREEGRRSRTATVGRSGRADRDADEILEGERKARSGIQPEGKPTGRRLGGTRQGPHREVQGRRRGCEAQRAATPDRQTLKASATPRRIGPPRAR